MTWHISCILFQAHKMMSCRQNSSSPAQYWPFLILINYAPTRPRYSIWHLLFPVCHQFPCSINCCSCCNVRVRCSEGWGPRFAITRRKDEPLVCQNHDECRDILTLHRTPSYAHHKKNPRHTKAQGFHTSCNLLGVLSLLSTWKLTSASQVLLPWWCLRWTNG